MISVLPALAAALYSPEAYEAHAFRAIYGTEDMDKLIKIEGDPVSFWREREERLMASGATIEHRTFCQQFVEEAKEYIAQNWTNNISKSLFRDGEIVDEVLQEEVPEDDAIWPTTRSICYGVVCDWVTSCDFLSAEDFAGSHGLRKVARSVTRNGIEVNVTEEFNRSQRWLAKPCKAFPIVDSLIMHSHGFYLNSAPAPEERWAFGAHPSLTEDFLFKGWGGVVTHDPVAHAMAQYDRASALKTQHNISETEHFKMYCNPKRIVCGNLIEQSQQHLGWFYNVHELAAAKESFDPDKLDSVLFPYGSLLIDRGFQDLVPLFVHPAKWKHQGFYVDKRSMDLTSETHALLMQWRNTHCYAGWDIAPASYFESGGMKVYPKKRALK